jgi:PAS domain S-box-containing protein
LADVMGAEVMISSDPVLVGSYNYGFVALSVVIAIVAAYAALDLAGRITSAGGKARFVWLSGGALAMGIGIWSMHYVGMLAFHLPIPVLYDWPTVLVSLLAAVFASAIALFVVSRKKMGVIRASVGSIFMGGGIAAMHYTGMAAMRLPAMCHWSVPLVILSVLLAVVISFVALLLTFYFRGDMSAWSWPKISSAVVMGAAIPAMHYTGMAAASFTLSATGIAYPAHAIGAGSLSAAAVSVVTFMVLGVVVAMSIADRRLAVQTAELEASQRYREIVDTAFDAFVGIDATGALTDWNAQAEAMFGWSCSEAIGRTVSSLIIPERYRKAHEQGLRRYFATGEGPVLNKRVEITGLHKDGREFPVELMISPIRWRGTCTFAAFVRDLSQRQQSEEASGRLAAIVQSSDDAIISKTVDGIIVTWNPAAERLFGYSAQEAVGKPMLMLIPAERKTEEPAILMRIAAGERVDHFETVRIRKDGKRIDVSVSISPMKDSQGRIFGASKIARDITERKAAEAKVQAHLVRLNLLHQITRAVGGRQDLRSIYQVVLGTLEEHLRFDFGCICDYDVTRQELTVVHVGAGSQKIGLELALTEQAHIPIDANGLSRCVRGQLVYEEDTQEVKMPSPQKLASAGLHSLVVAPLQVESKVFGVLVAARLEAHSFSSGECEFLRQLSEHVALAAHQAELHASLQQAYDDLRQTQQAVMQHERLRALGQMASGIAHDINNAISPMALSTELLLEKEAELSPRARKHLQMIQQAADDVAKTVARMKEFYRQREPQLTLAPVHIDGLLQQVVDLTRARWSDMPQQQGMVIEMRTDFAKNTPPIMGVESEIREALINLVLNAVDAMPSGGALTLRTRTVEHAADPLKLGNVVVEVTDTGAGMDEETRRRCLEPFFTTKGERGTGLGLAMVYGVVQRHSADLEIDSTPGKGTTMRLSFAVPAGLATDVALPETAFTVPSRLRILVVDDDPLILRALCETLESDGHEVITANGGEAGMDAFSAAQARDKSFSIVITDLGMPRVDGRKVASFVKSLSDSTPVILLTGWGQRLMAEGDVPPHVDRVLSKPPKLRDLREALALCLSAAELQGVQNSGHRDSHALRE